MFLLMEKKEILKIVIKVLIYALTLIGGYLGVSALTSCSSSHSVESAGITRIYVTDTTFVKHNGFIRSKNYLPYE
jgi:hypothetical protein